MVGILIITHGTLGESLIHCVTHVLNKRPTRVRQIGITAHDDPAMLIAHARETIRQLDDGSGVLVLSDIYGATPCNVVSRLLIPGKVEGVAGVNVPMLIRALTYRDQPLAEVVLKAVSGGCEGVLRIPALAVNNAATGG
jgi:PTS system ascorbate-specific IIA component